VNVYVFGFGTASSFATKSILGVYSKVLERNYIFYVRNSEIRHGLLVRGRISFPGRDVLTVFSITLSISVLDSFPPFLQSASWLLHF